MEYYDDSLDIQELLEKVEQQEQQRLSEALERIDQQLERREEIFSENIHELESKLQSYIERLEQEHQQLFTGSGNEDELKKKIDKFYREIRGEKRNLWLDRQELETERRHILQEMSELDDDLWESLL